MKYMKVILMEMDWQDFYLMHWIGDNNSEWIPNSNLFAWINDGNGHFTLE